MTANSNQEKSSSSFNYIKLLTIIGSIASIVALIFFFIPKDQSLELGVSTKAIENLTNSEYNDPNLRADYFFKDEKVDNLWKVSLELKNNSDKTLIISKDIGNILTDTLSFNVKSKFKILDYKLIHKDFESFVAIDENSLKLSFSQWRPQEKIELNIYVRSKSAIKLTEDIFTKNKTRPIVDGDISFYKLNQQQSKSKNGVSFISIKTKKIIYTISIAILFLLTVTFLVLAIGSLIGFYLRKRWKEKYLEKYNFYIHKTYGIENSPLYDLESVKRHMNRPERYYGMPNDEEFPMFPMLEVDFEIDNFFMLWAAFILTITFCTATTIMIIELITIFP